MSACTTNGVAAVPSGGPTPLRQLMKLAPVKRVVTRLREEGLDPREATENPGQWYARCPSHDDSEPSLAIGPTPDGKGARIHCHGHCDRADVLRALDLPVSALSARGRRGARLDAEAAEREGATWGTHRSASPSTDTATCCRTRTPTRSHGSTRSLSAPTPRRVSRSFDHPDCRSRCCRGR